MAFLFSMCLKSLNTVPNITKTLFGYYYCIQNLQMTGKIREEYDDLNDLI